MDSRVIVVLSYEAWRHPRAIKIVYSLRKHGYSAKLWGHQKLFKGAPRFLRAIMNYLVAFFEVLSLKADIYWVENVPDFIYLSLPLLRRKYVYDRRSSWARNIMIETGSRVLSKLAEVVERFMMLKATHIVVATSIRKHEYDYRKDVTVIPNYPEKRFIMKPKQTMRELLRIPKNVKIFGFIGKLSKVEGTDLLPQIAKKLEKLKDTELWIIGDGPLRYIAEKLAKKPHVRWFGWVKRNELPKYLASLNYGLVPLYKTPYTIFNNHEDIQKMGEYFAYNIPVIASGIAPSPFYLVVDPEDLAETIAKIAKGELKPPTPPRDLIWERVSEPRLISVLQQIFKSKQNAKD